MPTATRRPSVVLDASAAIRAAIDRNEQALSFFRAAEDESVDAAWPDLVFGEIAHGLLRLARAGRIGASDVLRETARLLAAPVRVEPVAALVIPAAALAHERSISVYDATYVALAERLDARLVTADRRLAAATELGLLVSG